MPLKTTTITVSFPDEMLEAIEDTRYKYRFGNRSSTIQYLVELGLAQLPTNGQPVRRRRTRNT